MKIKDYLMKVEVANEILELSNRNDKKEYRFYMAINYFDIISAKTWEEFKKIVEEDVISSIANKILNCDVKLNTNIQQMPTETDDLFTVEFWIE